MTGGSTTGGCSGSTTGGSSTTGSTGGASGASGTTAGGSSPDCFTTVVQPASSATAAMTMNSANSADILRPMNPTPEEHAQALGAASRALRTHLAETAI